MTKSANTSKKRERKPYFDNPDVEAAAAKVYGDGFNLYAAIGKLKKKMNRQSFPDEVIIGVCDSYWVNKPSVKNQWPWFLSAMEYQTRLWLCDQHEKESAEYKKAPIAQSIKDIMRGMFK